MGPGSGDHSKAAAYSKADGISVKVVGNRTVYDWFSGSSCSEELLAPQPQEKKTGQLCADL